MAIWDFAHVGTYVAIALPLLTLVGVVILAARLRAISRSRDESAAPLPPSERTDRALKLQETRHSCDKPEAEPSYRPSASPASPGLSSPFGTGKTVLVAEDDAEVAWSLSLRLERLGFRVWRSPDALHALLGVERIRPDAAILDVAMPGGNGLAVCEMLASDPGKAEIPRIVHTSRADEATRARCRELGAHYIEKTSSSWQQIESILEQYFASNREPPMDESAGNAPIVTAPPASDASPQQDTPTKPASASPASTPEESPVCGRARVLCIDGPGNELAAVERQLTDLGASVIRVGDKDEGFWTCFTEKPLVVILDGTACGKELHDLMARFQEHPVTRTLPLVVIGNGDGIPAGIREADHVLMLPRCPSDDDLLREVGRFIPLGTNDVPVAARNKHGDASSGPLEDRRLTILCVDDDPEIAYALSMRLEPYGVGVRAAMTGSAGFRDALNCKPDLILLDISMPDGEGNYVLGRLKSHSVLKAVPVVILTSDGNRAVRRQMLSMGAVGFLTKPVRWEELFAEMGQHMRLPERLVRDYKLPAELLPIADDCSVRGEGTCAT